MKSMKVFALTLLLSTVAAQGAYNWQRGLTDIGVGLAAGFTSAKWAPNGWASVALDSLARSSIADAGLDAASGQENAGQFDAAQYALLRARHAVAMFATSLAVKSLAIGQGGALDRLPVVGDAIAHSIGEFPLSCFGYLGLSNLIDGFMEGSARSDKRA